MEASLLEAIILEASLFESKLLSRRQGSHHTPGHNNHHVRPGGKTIHTKGHTTQAALIIRTGGKQDHEKMLISDFQKTKRRC